MRKILLVVSLMLSAAAVSAQTPTPVPTFTPTLVPPTPTFTPVPTNTPTPTAVPTYSPMQEVVIRTQLIAAGNRAKCGQFGRPDGCASADLSSNGCVPTSISVYVGLQPGDTGYTLFNTQLVESCQIFTQDAAGQAALQREANNRRLAEDFLKSKGYASVDFKARWLLFTGRDSVCATPSPAGLGLGTGCGP